MRRRLTPPFLRAYGRPGSAVESPELSTRRNPVLGNRSHVSRGVVAALVFLILLAIGSAVSVTAQRLAGGQAPKFTVDPFWPKPLPNRWLFGQVSGVAV